MGDGLQPRARGRDRRTPGRPAACGRAAPSAAIDVGPARGDLGVGRLPGRHHLARQLVGVDHRHAQRLRPCVPTVDLPEPMPPVRPDQLDRVCHRDIVPRACVLVKPHALDARHLPTVAVRELPDRGAPAVAAAAARSRPRSPSPAGPTWASRRCSTGWWAGGRWPAPRRRPAAPAASCSTTCRLRLARRDGSRRALRLVDLPGYGYAQVSQEERKSWQPLIEGYVERRATLALFLTLIDARRDLEDEERQLHRVAGTLWVSRSGWW